MSEDNAARDSGTNNMISIWSCIVYMAICTDIAGIDFRDDIVITADSYCWDRCFNGAMVV